MKKTTFSIALVALSVMSYAQKTILINGGIFGDPSENVSVSIYDTQSNTYNTIDTIHTQSVQDMLIDGSSAIVAAQDSIVRYDLVSQTRTAAVKFAGVSTKSLLLAPNNELIVSNWYGKSGYNIYIYNQTTLSLIDSINIPSGVQSMLVDAANNLLVVTQNQSTGAPNYKDTLGTIIAATISNRSVLTTLNVANYSGEVGQLITKPSGTGALAFNPISNTIIDVNAANFPFVTTSVIQSNQDFKVTNSSQFTLRGDTAFLRMNQGIGSMNLSSLTVIDSNLIDTVVTAFAYDTVSNRFYVTSTDFFSYTIGKVYNRQGTFVDTFSTASSPEVIKMYYGQTTGLLSFNRDSEKQFSIYPNPADSRFTIDTESNDVLNVQIRNSNGQLVKSIDNITPYDNIDVHNFNSGIYFISILSKGAIFTERLIIQ